MRRLDGLLALFGAVVVVFWAFSLYGVTPVALGWAVFGIGLVSLAVIDLRTMLLPDVLTLPLMWLGICMQLFPQTTTIGLEASVWGVIAGYVPLWLLAHLYYLVRRRDGLGFGDLKLLAAMGAWSGPAILPLVIFIAALSALIAVVSMRLWRRTALGGEFPFGPWIILAYMICNIPGFMMSVFLMR